MIKFVLGFTGVAAILSAAVVIGLCRLNSPISREEEERELETLMEEYRSGRKTREEEHE